MTHNNSNPLHPNNPLGPLGQPPAAVTGGLADILGPFNPLGPQGPQGPLTAGIVRGPLLPRGPMHQPNPVATFFGRRHPFMFDRPAIDRAALPLVIRQVLERPVSYYEELKSAKPGPHDKPLTNVAFILDVSESMNKGKRATIDGFNDQVQVVRAGAEGAGETAFTEVQFNGQVSVRRVAAELSTLVPLTEETYKPDGSTSLYDALGDTIEALLLTPRMAAPTTATLVTLFTDGDENSSSRYDAAVLGELVKRLEATGRWTFALVGPKASVRNLASMLSVRESNVAGYNPESVEDRIHVMGRMRDANTSYMTMRSMGMTQASCLYDDNATS